MARTVNPQQHAAKRRHICDHAAVLFATHGFEGTSTAQICEAAGISPGNLYHYFSSKMAIFTAIVTDDDSNDTAQAFTRCLTESDPLDGVVGFVDHLAAAAAADPIVPQLVLEAMQVARRDKTFAARLDQDSLDEHASIVTLVQRAQSAGIVDDTIDPADTAAWLQALVGAIYLEAAHNPEFNAHKQQVNLARTVRAYLTTNVRPAV